MSDTSSSEPLVYDFCLWFFGGGWGADLNLIQYVYFIDVVHQYDGIVKEKPEKDKNKDFIKTINMIKGLIHDGDFTKHMKADAAFSFRHFVPHVQLIISDTSGICGEDIIQHIDSIFDGLKTTYLVAAGLWYSSRDYYAYLSKVIFYD